MVTKEQGNQLINRQAEIRFQAGKLRDELQEIVNGVNASGGIPSVEERQNGDLLSKQIHDLHREEQENIDELDRLNILIQLEIRDLLVHLVNTNCTINNV